MKIRVRSESATSNPGKMLLKKKQYFKYKCYIAISVAANLILAGYILYKY